MSQTIHILRKDVLRLWPLLAAFGALLVLRVAGAWNDPLTMEPSWRLESFGPLFELTAILLVGMLVHQDPLVGTNAFWLTRPISRLALMASKAFFLLIFVVLPPVAAHLGILASFGLDPATDWPALFEALAVLLALVAGGLVLATVTPNLPVYFVAWISVVVVVSLLSHLLSLLVEVNLSVGLSGSRMIVATVTIIVASGLIASHQYLTRRTQRSIVSLSVGFLLLIALTSIWPWNVLKALHSGDTRSIDLSFDPGGDTFTSEVEGSDVSISGLPRILGAASDEDVELRLLTGEFHTARGRHVPQRHTSSEMYGDAAIRTLPEYAWVGRQGPPISRLRVMALKPELFQDLVGSSGAYVGEARGERYSYRRLGAVPLKAGMRFHQGSVSSIIRSVSIRPAEVLVVVLQRHVRTSLRRDKSPKVLLANPDEKQVLREINLNVNQIAYANILGTPSVNCLELTLRYPLELNSGTGGVIKIDRDWLAAAELVFLEWVPRGEFRTEFRIDNFRINDYASIGTAAAPSESN